MGSMLEPSSADGMRDNLAVSTMDIVRLFVEFAEKASVTHLSKDGIISAFREVIRIGITGLEAQERSVTFEVAVKESLQARRHRRPSTLSDLRSYTSRMLRCKEFRIKYLRNIDVDDCHEMLHRQFGHSPHVFRKAKTILHSIFGYGIRRGWCSNNPVIAIDCPPIHEERIRPLSGVQIRSILRCCQDEDLLCLLPSVLLMLYCGIRPGEVRRLRWRDVDRREKVVYVEGYASKTGGPRAVPLRGRALELLNYRRSPDELIAPRNWTRLWKRLRTRAGIKRWQRDVMRHTFASYHLKRFHNLVQLQEEMGHRDSNLLRTRYLNVRHVSTSTARRFFG